MVKSKTSSEFPNEETVVAIITPPGEGGIAALRLAGPGSLNILTLHLRTAKGEIPRHIKPFLMRSGRFVDKYEQNIDEVLSVYMSKDHSYTGREQAEIFCHGGNQAAQKILNTLIDSGARAAEPGEFTKMAFLSGRIDLSKAEAVAELIGANTEKSFAIAKEHLIDRKSTR